MRTHTSDAWAAKAPAAQEQGEWLTPSRPSPT